MAWAASQRALTVRADATANRDAPTGEQLTLPRGQVVIFGGDEVYPVARVEDYQDRFVGPYKAALPWTDPPTASTASDAPGAHPRLLAIPGNHDWYDGLTGFIRVFGQQSWIGGRQSVQTRSYFAAALPARWWLWGIDIQSDAYLDSAQIRYFRDVGTKIAAGDRLILCTAKPSWAEGHEPDAYRNLAYVERNLVPDHCEAVLMISGDSHHYARYRSDTGREKITAGGGGAFLSATHTLQKEVDVPTAPDGDLSRHELQRCYPDARTSSRLAWRALALPFRNPSFMWVPGILHVLLFMANQFGLRSVQNGSSDFETAAGNWSWLDLALGRLRNPLTLVVILTLFALLTGFAKPPASIRARWAKLATRLGMGGFHTILQLATAATVAYAATRLLGFADGFAYVVLVVLFIAVVGAVCGAIALGLYLVLALCAARDTPDRGLLGDPRGGLQELPPPPHRARWIAHGVRTRHRPSGEGLGPRPRQSRQRGVVPEATRRHVDRRPTHRPDIVRSELAVGRFTSTGGR